MSIEDGTYYIVAGDQPANTNKQWGFYLKKNPMMQQAGETDFQQFQITKGGPENNQYSIQSQGGDKPYLGGYINGEIRKDHYENFVPSGSKEPFWWDVIQEFKRYYCDPDPDISHPPDYYDPKDPENPHGTSTEVPEPTSTSTSSPTSTPKPPVKTIDICLGSSTSTTSQFPIHNYLVYPPDSACSGLYITDPSIGSSTPVCDIPKDEVTFNYCSEDGDAKFVDEGPEFFDGCGFQLVLDGKKYTPKQLDPSDDDNPCSYSCSNGDTIS